MATRDTGDSAVEVLGGETLPTTARELVDTVKQNLTIDWTFKESVRVKVRVTAVLQQADLLSDFWTGASA